MDFHASGISLEDFFTISSDMVQLINSDGTILYANPRWQECLGYDEYAMQHLNFFDDILVSACHAQFRTQLESLTHRDKINQHIPLTLLSKSHKKILVDTHIIHTEDTETGTILCIFHVIEKSREIFTEQDRIFELSVDMLGIADFTGHFIRLNQAWEHVLGYTLDELTQTPFISFVHPDDREATTRAIALALQTQSFQTFENRYLCKDGSVKWFSWHYRVYPEIEQTYFVARDITAERMNQNLLREARDRLEAILDNSGTMIGLKNLEGNYILVNQEFADIFAEGNKSDLIGKSDADIFSLATAEQLAGHEQLVLEKQHPQQFEEHIITANGMRTYLTTRFILHDKESQSYGLCMIAKDITYRKLTEVQLLMRNQAIEHSPTGISIADARLPDMPLIYINPAFEKNTGYSSLDVIGRNCRFLQNDDRDQDGVHQIRKALQNEKSVTVVIRNYRKNGELFYNELGLAPIHNDVGELTHYVGISTDVTARIESEVKIQNQNQELMEANRDLARAREQAEQATAQLADQNQELISANHNLAIARKQAEDATRLKSQFLATMSHELRTPLNAIIGYTEIQLAGMTGELTEEQRDYQERVVTNADHLLNLINDVLDISKIEAGRMELVHKVFNLRDWVSGVDNQMRVLAEDKLLEFIVAVDERMPDNIVGDPARVKQVVINLLSNAIKFTEEGSIHMNIRKHGRDAWQIIITDAGIGIAPHMQETIFEEFRQVDSTSRRKTGGTGLGLAIVRKLLLMMGGTIRLKSQLGEGSTFTVTLPLEKEGTRFLPLVAGGLDDD